MNREEAYRIVTEHVKNTGLINHMLAVEAAMRAYARRYGEDEEAWGRVGLLHDFDWEIHPTLDKHPMDGAPILRARGIAEDEVLSILSHAEHSGIPRESLRDKALYAVDELTGLVMAVALVRPSKDIADVTVKSIRNKWKDRAFAGGVNRDDIEAGCRDLGVDLWEEHVPLVLAALQEVAPALSLDGRLAAG